MDKLMHSSLSNVENKLNSLLSSITSSPTAVGAPAAAIALLDADDALSSAVETLRQHQANYSRILELRDEAQKLEERVKSIVRDIDGFEKDIRVACNEVDESESDETSDSEPDTSDDESDADRKTDTTRRTTQEGAVKDNITRRRGRAKEVDYKLLLDFARRISKYNHQAAADAAAGASASVSRKGKRDSDPDVAMTGLNGVDGPSEGGIAGPAEPVSSLTKSATKWLDESATMTREVYMLPYPAEERIRMGLMGQIQLMAAEGRSGFDPEKEVERIIREAEGLSSEEIGPSLQGGGEESLRADEAANAAVRAGARAVPARAGPAPTAPKPKPLLDLDLYDPDEDDV